VGSDCPSSNVYTLWASPFGGLWVGYAFGGASFINDGRITNYGEREGLPVGSVRDFAQDKSGTLWVATTRGVRRFNGSQWIDVSAELGLPKTYVSMLSFDRTGTLWVAVDNSIMFLPPGQSTLVTADTHLDGDGKFLEGPDGTLWLSDDKQGIRAMYSPVGPMNASKDWIRLGDPQLGPVGVTLIDREGTFWMSTPTGIRRLRDAVGILSHGLTVGDSADVFCSGDGMTGPVSSTSSALQDREGNVWLGTAGGLDRFRESRITRVALGVKANSNGFALAAGDDGALLVGAYLLNGAFKVTAASTVETVAGPREINCAYRDPEGIIWLGGPEKIWRSAGLRWVAIDLPVHNLTSRNYSGVQAMVKDRSGTLGVSVVRAGVFRLTDGKWDRYGDPHGKHDNRQ